MDENVGSEAAEGVAEEKAKIATGLSLVLRGNSGVKGGGGSR